MDISFALTFLESTPLLLIGLIVIRGIAGLDGTTRRHLRTPWLLVRPIVEKGISGLDRMSCRYVSRNEFILWLILAYTVRAMSWAGVIVPDGFEHLFRSVVLMAALMSVLKVNEPLVLVALGGVMNIAALAANGFMMPSLLPSPDITMTPGHILLGPSTRLVLLCDILPATFGGRVTQVLSIGDVSMYIGILLIALRVWRRLESDKNASRQQSAQ